MANDIDVTDIAVSRPRQSPPSRIGVEAQVWYDITIGLRNNTRKTQYVIAEPRNIAYDAATRTLNLQLDDSAMAPETAQAYVMPHTPKQVAIPAGGTERIQIAVPAILRRMRPSSGLALAVEQIDIAGFEKVSCTIAYNQSRLVPVQQESATERLRRHQSWGKRVSATETVRRPDESGNPGPDPKTAR